MKYTFAKGLLTCTGVTGVGCAVAFPLVYKKQSNTGFLESNESRSSDNLLINGDGLNLARNNIQKVPLRSLGTKLDGEYKKKQGENSEARPNLSFESEFKSALEKETQGDQGIIHLMEGKTCRGDNKGQKVYCGYLEFEDGRLNSKYKLQISHETGVSDNDEGSGILNLVRAGQERNKIEHGVSGSKTGKQIDNNSLDKFFSFTSDQGLNGGESLIETSINSQIV